MERLKELSELVIAGDAAAAPALARELLDGGADPRALLDGGLVAGMSAVGERFKAREIFLPDVLLASKAMLAALAVLQPRLSGEGLPSRGTVVLGTVQGDLHDIGKNLVGIMLRGAGWRVVDLGKDVAPERFVEAARAEGAAVIGCSALLTTTMGAMRRVVELARVEGLPVKVIVGGAPITADFAASIGADGFGYDAGHAVERVNGLAGGA
jgi:5-methyltetrahydrofolate--homocysteine methyltransferase